MHSPALEAGDPTQCALLTVDQLGNARPNPAGTTCDIGAIEMSIRASTDTPTATATATATNTATATATATRDPGNVTMNGTTCNIYDAIDAANSNSATGMCPAGMTDTAGADVIVLTKNITMNGNFATIVSKIEIDGTSANTYTIDGGDRHYGFATNVRAENGGFVEADLTLKNLKLTNMRRLGSGAAISHLRGLVTLDKVEIRDSSAGNGAAIDVDGEALTVRNSKFVDNSASSGGGGAIRLHSSGFASTETVTIENSEFISNSAPTDSQLAQGGAILVDDGYTLNISNSIFRGNQTGGLGGAIYAVSATVTVNGATFENNSATRNGGAINKQSSGTMTVSNSTFSGNSSGARGGAFWGTNVTLRHVTISGNTAP